MSLVPNDMVDFSVAASPSRRTPVFAANVKKIAGQVVTLLLLPPYCLSLEPGARISIKKDGTRRFEVFEATVKAFHPNTFTLTAVLTGYQQKDQRRAFIRYFVSLAARYSGSDEQLSMPARVWDISEGGVCLMSSKEHVTGDTLTIKLPLRQTLRLPGMVQLCMPQSEDAAMYALGIQFFNCDKDRVAIRQFLLDQQMKRVRAAGSSLYNNVCAGAVMNQSGSRYHSGTIL